MKESDIRNDELLALSDKYYVLDLKNIMFNKEGKDFVEITCPACHGNNHNIEKKLNGFNYCVCKDCDTMYVSPRPDEKKLDSWYTESEYVSNIRYRNLAKHRQQRYENIVLPRARYFCDQLRLDTKTIKILDIGCGDGSLLQAFHEILSNKYKVELHGVEKVKSEHALTENITMHYGSFEEMEIEEKFDIICCIELIEHVFNPSLLLENISRRLTENGYLYVTTPNWHGADFQFIGNSYRNLRAPTHIQFFHPDSLKRIVENNGFKNVCIDTPGLLDVNLVIKHYTNISETNENRLVRFLSSDTELAENARKDLQKFLQKYGISGSMRCIAQKS